MKLVTIITALAICMLSLAIAKAEISADLRFCADQKTGRERLACYDAAMRIERAPVSQQVVIAPTIEPSINAVVPSTARPSGRGFHGAYVGVTGGYDFRVSRAYTQETYPIFNLFTSNYPVAPLDSIAGGNIGGAFGINTTAGPILVGLEFSGRYSFANSSASGDFSYPSQTFPFITGSTCCSLQAQPLFAPTSFRLSTDQRIQAIVSRPYSADLSMRLGVVHDDMLFYGKIGAGLERTISRFRTDDSRSQTCVSPIVQSDFSNGATTTSIVGCQAVQNGTIVTTTILNGISPLVLVGAGFEKNFDDVFVRAEAQLEGHFVPGSTGSFYYTPAASIAVGYRF